MGVENDVVSFQKVTTSVREAGGTFVPVWPKYFKDCLMVIVRFVTSVMCSPVQFVVDASNPAQISAACMEFYNLLKAADLTSKSILLVFSKVYVLAPKSGVSSRFLYSDLPGRLTRMQLSEMMRLSDLTQVGSCALLHLILHSSELACEGSGMFCVYWHRAGFCPSVAC